MLKVYERSLINQNNDTLNDIFAPNHRINIENLAESIKEHVDYYTSQGDSIDQYRNININDVQSIDSEIIDADTVKFEVRTDMDEYLLKNYEEFYSKNRIYYLTLLFKIKDNHLLLYEKN